MSAGAHPSSPWVGIKGLKVIRKVETYGCPVKVTKVAADEEGK